MYLHGYKLKMPVDLKRGAHSLYYCYYVNRALP